VPHDHGKGSRGPDPDADGDGGVGIPPHAERKPAYHQDSDDPRQLYDNVHTSTRPVYGERIQRGVTDC
jgi:hypothetical protein